MVLLGRKKREITRSGYPGIATFQEHTQFKRRCTQNENFETEQPTLTASMEEAERRSSAELIKTEEKSKRKQWTRLITSKKEVKRM